MPRITWWKRSERDDSSILEIPAQGKIFIELAKALDGVEIGEKYGNTEQCILVRIPNSKLNLFVQKAREIALKLKMNSEESST